MARTEPAPAQQYAVRHSHWSTGGMGSKVAMKPKRQNPATIPSGREQSKRETKFTGADLNPAFRGMGMETLLASIDFIFAEGVTPAVAGRYGTKGP